MAEDELIERIARALDHPSVYMGGASQQSKLKVRRAILPFIHEARIEGGKMVQDKIVDWLRVQQHGRTSDNYPGYYARRIEDGEWKR